MRKKTRRLMYRALVFTVVIVGAYFLVSAFLTVAPIHGVDGTDGKDGTNGTNGAAADYTIQVAPDNSWYAAIPGRYDLAAFNTSDASNTFDAAILALNNSVAPGGIIHVLNGIYPIKHTILLEVGVTLRGSGVTTIILPKANFGAMVADSGNSYASVCDITIKCSEGAFVVGIGVNSTGIGFTADNVWVNSFTVTGITVGPISGSTFAEITVSRCHINSSLSCDFQTFAGISAKFTSGAIISDCFVSQINGTGIIVQEDENVILDHCMINNVNGTGIIVNNSISATVHNGCIKNASVNGISVIASTLVIVSHYDITDCVGTGLFKDTATYGTMDNLFIARCGIGLETNNANNNTITNIYAINNTGSGISLVDSLFNVISNVHTSGNNIGLEDSVTSDYNSILTSFFGDSLTVVGTNDNIAVSWDAGTFILTLTGPYP